MTDLVIGSPIVGIAILVVFVVSGKVFRDSWKLQGSYWKVKCWIAGLIAAACFGALAFIPFQPV